MKEEEELQKKLDEANTIISDLEQTIEELQKKNENFQECVNDVYKIIRYYENV